MNSAVRVASSRSTTITKAIRAMIRNPRTVGFMSLKPLLIETRVPGRSVEDLAHGGVEAVRVRPLHRRVAAPLGQCARAGNPEVGLRSAEPHRVARPRHRVETAVPAFPPRIAIADVPSVAG